ncbi:ATP-binding cassette domain-containing protein [Eggerthella lenta]|uniref:ABC transporter ATP-binding protein n=1 Tax=Eggerthella lenta TaxID=84112 RepID=UPI003DA304D3
MDIVAVDNLVKRYNEVLALDHFSLHIEPDEVFGLLGPNGSGKTTAINCILQLLTYDKGTIELFGQTMRPSSYDLKRRIGIVPQNVAVFEELTVRENIDYFCALYVNDRAKRRDLVDEAIAFVGLEDYEKFRPRKLSGGLLRRLNIACGIAHKPELIFFDEPTVAVDPQSRNAILEGIQNMNRQGSTVVYTSHYMEEVEEICTRIMIMDHGQALATGTNAELKAMIGTGEKIQIDVPELDEATLARLDALPHVTRTLYREGTLELACQNGTHNVSDVLAVLQRDGAQFGRIYAEPPTLNDVFLEITGTELRD